MRPGCAIGHVGPLPVSSIQESVTFYGQFGMRKVMANDAMAILEMRGGTHLILRRAPVSTGRVPFDLMVDDIPGLRDRLVARGQSPSPIREGGVHQTFTLKDPDGRRVAVTSSHAMGPV